MVAVAATLAAGAVPGGEPRAEVSTAPVVAREFRAIKRAEGAAVNLFLWRKQAAVPGPRKGTALFVHGSSVSSLPVFDLQIPGRPEASTMDWFARLGYDTWCVDCEGYGKSDKSRAINADIACGADDLAAASETILKENGGEKLLLYGASSGALRAGLFAQRHPERVKRLVLDAFVWTGEGSPTLAERKKRVAEYRARNRRPIDRAITPAPATSRSSRRSPMRCSRSTTRCRPERISTCRRTCRYAIRRRSPCRC
jgi:pimeloyl-ACP methyl ester carboxylesterase